MRKRLLGSATPRTEEEEPAINLTPLIDVVFVILIMFIVVAPLLDYENVELAEASSSDISQAKSVAASSPISIHVKADNTVYLNGECIACENLTAQLQQLRQVHPDVNPQLFQDKRAQFGAYQKVKNAAEAAGYSAIDLILAPP
jgi:biopolymer transport protein ExbD